MTTSANPVEFVGFFVGSGFADESMEEVARSNVDFIGADAGTVDTGPYQLAGLGSIFPEAPCERDLRLALRASRRLDVPLLIGSCGGSGSDAGVDWFATIVRRIAAEEGHRFRMARIYSELSADYVVDKLRADKVTPLFGAPPYDEEVVRRSHRIVGAMGAEPFSAALEGGADVVLAGRSTDTAIFAAVPMMRGSDHGLSWHAAKIAECGTAVAETPGMDLIHLRIEQSSFVVEPIPPHMRCTPVSVAAHQLYENPDPHFLVEPSGTLDASRSIYEPAGPRSVRVSGSRFTPATTYTVKLEGVEQAGFQSVTMASFTDPVLLEDLDCWLESMQEEVQRKVARVFGEDARSAISTLRVYGRDGTMAAQSPIKKFEGHEAFLLLDVVASTQSLASGIASLAWHTMIHQPTRGWTGWLTAAWPFNPPVMDRGPVFRFNVNHTIALENPLESVRMVYEDVK